MKAIESYRKDTVAVAGCHGTLTGVILCNSFPGFLSDSYAKYYSTKRKSVKMLRIHQSNLFHIRRSLHQIFGSAVTAIMILSTHTFVRAISFDDERLRRSFNYVIGID